MKKHGIKIKEGFLGQRMLVLPPDIRKRIITNEIIKDFYLTAIGYYPYANHHDRERKNGCGEYILLYCLEGQGSINVNNKTIELSANEFFIIPINTPHHYKSSFSNPWSIYWVHFTGNNAGNIYSRYAKNSANKTMKIPFNEQRSEQFLNIIRLLETGFDDAHLELANIYLLQFVLSFIYQALTDETMEQKNPITQSIKYMKKNIDRPLTIKDLASEQFLSISRYSELFKKETGTSPINYLIHLKMQKSCQYLYFTNMSIKEIATSLGFSDPFYFSRMFKKVWSISPSKYKNEYKK